MLSPTTSPCLCIVWYRGSGEGGATRIFVTAYAAAAAVATIAVGTSVAVAVTLASSVRLYKRVRDPHSGRGCRSS
jgi:hypothetical protein